MRLSCYSNQQGVDREMQMHYINLWNRSEVPYINTDFLRIVISSDDKLLHACLSQIFYMCTKAYQCKMAICFVLLWAYCQIRKIGGCASPGNAGNVSTVTAG